MEKQQRDELMMLTGKWWSWRYHSAVGLQHDNMRTSSVALLLGESNPPFFNSLSQLQHTLKVKGKEPIFSSWKLSLIVSLTWNLFRSVGFVFLSEKKWSLLLLFIYGWLHLIFVCVFGHKSSGVFPVSTSYLTRVYEDTANDRKRFQFHKLFKI